VDPLAEDFPWNSPYAFAENDVIRNVDLDGLEKVETKFTFTTGKPKVQLINSEITIVNANAPREEIFKIQLANRIYTANSYKTLEGRDNGIDEIGDFSGISTLQKEDLISALGYASYIINDVYNGNVEQATALQSNAFRGSGKELDFKSKMYDLRLIGRNQLLEIDGVTYNANEAGNYLWGLSLEYHASFISPNAIAEAGSQIQGRSDEPHEQKAISAGRIKALNLLKDNSIKGAVLERRIEYRENAKDKK
tara:strand:+ start:23948 stop:24700 length:753 start_codon:yes stop_codon:yes gene_type:complete